MTKKLLVILSILVVLSGCSTILKQEDVSAELPYKTYVGAKYVLSDEMHLSGVNSPPGYEDTVDYYVVNPLSPSWGGPELITREVLPSGTIFQINAMFRCTNCLFERPIKAQISFLNYMTKLDRPIHIALKDFPTPLSEAISVEKNGASSLHE